MVFWHALLIVTSLALSPVSRAYDGLRVEPASQSLQDEEVAWAIKQSLLDAGCLIRSRDDQGLTPPATSGTLTLQLAPLDTDTVSGRYSGYGVELNSTRWTGSLRSELRDPKNLTVIALFDERAEERGIPLSSNGNQSLSDLVTDAEVLQGLIRKLGKQTAAELIKLPSVGGICVGTKPIRLPQITAHNTPDPGHLEQSPSEAVTKEEGWVAENPPKIEAKSQAHEPTQTPSQKVFSGKEPRVALVIGNSDYSHIPQLRNPANDARLIADQIRASGFELVGGAPFLDLNKTDLEHAIAEFGRMLTARPGAVGFFYYAGHGVQVNGSNYLIPISANPSRIADLSRQAVQVDSLLQEMEDSRTGLNILVLDACRNNPFSGRGIRQSGAGLAQMRAPKGSIIVYATQPGNIAQDGPSGKNSPFAMALGSALSGADLDLFETFNQVGLMVSDKTGGEQQPWISSSPIEGRFCFRDCRR